MKHFLLSLGAIAMMAPAMGSSGPPGATQTTTVLEKQSTINMAVSDNTGYIASFAVTAPPDVGKGLSQATMVRHVSDVSSLAPDVGTSDNRSVIVSNSYFLDENVYLVIKCGVPVAGDGQRCPSLNGASNGNYSDQTGLCSEAPKAPASPLRPAVPWQVITMRC